MTYETILLEREDHLTWVTLNRPERLNALNDRMLDELSAALAELAADDTPVVAIRRAGRAFSAGYDIAPDEEEIGGRRDAAADRDRLAGNIARFFEIWDHPKPVLAVVHGWCLAGATQLCVFCDLTLVAEDAQIGGAALPIGGGYVEPLWAPLIGPKRAKQIAFVPGSRIDGVTAAAWGWANCAVPEERLFDETRRLAAEMAKVPSDVQRINKLAINRMMEAAGFRAAAPLVADLDAVLHATESVREIQDFVRDHGLETALDRYRSGGW